MPVTGSQRHLFDIPDDVTYLNAAYFSPQLRAVRAAGLSALDQADSPWKISSEDFFSPVEHLRTLFAELIGGDADGVAIIPSVSYGAAIASANLDVGPGRQVVVLEEQFPSNVYPWLAALDRTGGDIVTVPRPADGGWTAPVLDVITAQTAVVTVPNCHWTDGSLVDLAAVGEATREVGAALVIDASQSLGAVPFDTATIRPDFVYGVGYKWLLGPFGLGYLWAAPQHRDGTPLEEGWIVRSGAEDFGGLVDYQDEYAPGARRYDVGERSTFHLLPMAVAALDQLLAWGISEVAAAIGNVTDEVERKAVERGLQVAPSAHRARHMIGVRAPDGLPEGLVSSLGEQGVFVSVRGDSIRISPHLYNDESDIDRLFGLLDESL
jgi:selenocysteine lyase/cysteine desulfurase